MPGESEDLLPEPKLKAGALRNFETESRFFRVSRGRIAISSVGPTR